MSAPRVPPPRPRARSPLARAAMGLAVTLTLLLLAEAAARGLLGPPPRQTTLVRETLQLGDQLFVEEGASVYPSFQGTDSIGPFARAPTTGQPRVMVFGESSVRGGSRLSVSQEFPALTEGLVRSRGLPVEVLNLGRPGLDTGTIGPVIRAALGYEPEVVVLYLGHNDVGNVYMGRTYSGARGLAAHLASGLSRSALYGWSTVGLLRLRGGSASTGSSALSPRRRAEIAAQLQTRVEAMIREAQAAGARAMVMTPISNIGQWRSKVPVCEDLLPGAWSWRDGRPWFSADGLSRATVDAALAAEPACAEALYARATLAYQAGDLDAALRDARAARDHDPTPLRANEEVLAALRAAARATGATLVDTEAQISETMRIPPSHFFSDTLHPSATGHAELANALAPALAAVLSQGR